MLHTLNDKAECYGAVTDDAEQADVRLIRRIVAGELSAFEDIYRMYYPRLTRFLRRVTQRPELVEEVLNDTMLVVWNRAAAFNGSSKVSTWIFAIAYRKALKGLSRVDDPVDDKLGEHRENWELGPEDECGQRQRSVALARMLASLSTEHRAVVDLTYFHGMSYAEIAAIVGCPVNTVKTRMFHARRHLKTMMTGQLEDWL